MRAEYLDRFSRLESPIHRVRSWVKLLVAVMLVVGVVALPREMWPGLAGVAVVLIVVAAMSRIPGGFLVRRMLWLEPFAVSVAVLALFGPGGWRMFLWLVARSNLCLLVMLLLSNTTPFSELLEVMRRMKAPPMLITTLALMYRYLFLILDEAGRMKRARASRSFGGTKSHKWRMGATIVSQLFIRTSERAEVIFAAMRARGWQ